MITDLTWTMVEEGMTYLVEVAKIEGGSLLRTRRLDTKTGIMEVSGNPIFAQDKPVVLARVEMAGDLVPMERVVGFVKRTYGYTRGQSGEAIVIAQEARLLLALLDPKIPEVEPDEPEPWHPGDDDPAGDDDLS